MKQWNNSFDRASLLSASFCLALSSGYLSGRLLVSQQWNNGTMEQSSITLVSDKRPFIPTLHINGVRNGLLHGKIIGSARVVIGSNVLTQSGVFALDASPLLVNEIAIMVPDWAKFVASKRGSKYYPVFSSVGEKLSPKNRIYFRTEAEAEEGGYLKS